MSGRDDNDHVVEAHRARRAASGDGRLARRPAALPAVNVAGGVALGLLALAESIVRSAVTGVSVERAVVLCVVALATTAPVMLAAEGIAAVAAVCAAVASVTLFHTLTIAGCAAQLVILYRLGRSRAARSAWPPLAMDSLTLCLPLVFLVLALVRPVPVPSETGVLVLLLAALAPAAELAGVARRERGEALRHDAARQAVAGDLLEHVARGERARIARELHDVVAHHISMIAVQAETARLTTPGLPDAGARSLGAIGDTARAALTEMRRLLGVLREDAELDGPELSPQPGLEQLGALLDQTRDTSGSAGRLILSGRPRRLDPGVELAAYRIVQEALTNARRHARGAAVDVELHYGDHTIGLRVRDNGPGPAADKSPEGHGLTGMRERAVAVGGRLRTGPAPGGGFLVEATLPGEPAGSAT
jgi:signal transduction histidine kinase